MNAHTLPGLSQELENSSKFYSKENSGSYIAVVKSTQSVNKILGQTVTPANHLTVYDQTVTKYQQMLQNCQSYLRTHSRVRLTGTGRARKSIIREISSIAERDLTILQSNGLAAVAEKLRADTPFSMSSIIATEARTEKINLGDGREVISMAGGSSTRLKFKHGGRDVFFTEETPLQAMDEAALEVIGKVADDADRAAFEKLYDPVSQSCLTNRVWFDYEMPDFVEKQNTLLEQGKRLGSRFRSKADFVRDFSQRYHLNDRCKYDFSSDEKCQLFGETCVKIARAYNGASNFESMGEITVGTNIASRNVAMSRLADLLGVGDLLARSTSAEVTWNGRKVAGSVMEKAEGESLQALGQGGRLQNADITTGDMQKQLICLQLLDSLCGQVDRNINNYFFATEQRQEGGLRFASLQGIDNDMSFGKIDDLAIQHSALPPLFRTRGDPSTFALPVVDRQMAERLLAISPEMVKFAVADIITDTGEQEALVSRLINMQEGLKKLQEMHSDTHKTFLEHEDWGEDSERLLNPIEPERTGTYVGIEPDQKPNYYAEFVRRVRTLLPRPQAAAPAQP